MKKHHRIHKFSPIRKPGTKLFDRLFYNQKCKTCGEKFWDGKHKADVIKFPKYRSRFTLRKIKSHCHKYGCWINYEGKPVCGHYNRSGAKKGYCCEKVQSKVYVDDVLFKVSDIVIENY